MNVEQFYLENPPKLDVISKPQWRQYRFLLQDQRFLKVPDVIRTSENLQAWLVQKQPLDAYYSVAKFLNPRTMGPKTERISDNMFLGADLVFDIDETPFNLKNMEKAKQTTRRLLAWTGEQKININYIAFSGSKGFHVVCQDPFNYNQETPLEREKAAKEYRIQIVEQLQEKDIAIDGKVTKDTRRIFRIPGTINSKTGQQCIVLEPGDLQKPFTQILNKSRKVVVSAFPIRKEMTDTLQVPRTKRGLHRWNARSAPTHYYTSLLSSRVSGTKLHAPIIVLNTLNTIHAKKILAKIQTKYQLSDVYLFRADNLFAFTTDALQPKRIQKILNAAKAKNATFFKKHGKTFTRIAPKTSPQLDTWQTAPHFVEVLRAPTPSRYPSSHAHQTFLAQCDITITPTEKKAGKKTFHLRHVVMEA